MNIFKKLTSGFNPTQYELNIVFSDFKKFDHDALQLEERFGVLADETIVKCSQVYFHDAPKPRFNTAEVAIATNIWMNLNAVKAQAIIGSLSIPLGDKLESKVSVPMIEAVQNIMKFKHFNELLFPIILCDLAMMSIIPAAYNAGIIAEQHGILEDAASDVAQ